MNSTSAPKSVESHDASAARADERLVHAHEELKRADEQLARLSEQVARMERNTARAPSTGVGSKPPPGRRSLGALIGLPLAACIVVAALVWQSSFGGGAKPVAAPSPPQLVSTPSLPPENPQLAAEPTPAAVPAVVAEAAPPQATVVAPPVPQDAAPPTTAALPDHTQLLQTMARNLANMERSIEQLKANQQQMARDSAKEIAELKASQEELKRVLAKVSEQNPPKVLPPSPPPAQAAPTVPPAAPAPAVRKPERTVQSPRERTRPRFRRDWYYDDW